jgi:hypothetical protein
MSEPKICIFSETYYPIAGSGATKAVYLAKGLAANGLAANLLTRRSDTSTRKVERSGQGNPPI